MRALNASNGVSEWLPIEEDGKGTYIFNSKDLNMLARLKEMEGAGICSFKIEGRMKSGYYLATVINAYRRYMDGEPLEISEEELLGVSHRTYTQAYADGNNPHTVNYQDSISKGEYTYIADVLSYKDGNAEVEMRNRFKTGEPKLSRPKASSCQTLSVTIWLSGSCRTKPILAAWVRLSTCSRGVPL